MDYFFKYAVGFAGVYALCGVAFAVVFVFRRMGSIDPSAKMGTWGFRLLVLPGLIALWPLLFFLVRLKSSSFSDTTAFSLRSNHRIAIIALAVFAVFIFAAALAWRAPSFGELPEIKTPLP